MAPPDRERSGATVTVAAGGGPRHVRGEVLAVRRAGAHRVVTLSAPGVPATFRPGTFLRVSESSAPLGDGGSGAWWIHRVEATSAFGPTVEVVVDPAFPAGAWLSGLMVGTPVAVTGALGRPWTLPKQPVPVVLVGEGQAVAPLLALAERLRERSCAATLLVGAPDESHLFAVREARRLVRQVVVVTADGSVGHRGRVDDHLTPVLAGTGAAVVYAAGQPAACRAVARAAGTAGVPSQVALEVPMPCGTGLCHGCVVPVADAEGAPHWVRACHEGPVLPGQRVDWASLDCEEGAP